MTNDKRMSGLNFRVVISTPSGIKTTGANVNAVANLLA